MKLLRLMLKGVLGAPDGTYSFADPRTGSAWAVVLVTGPASSGKTALLRAIIAAKEIVGSYGLPPDTKHLLRPGATRGRIEATWEVSPEEQARAGLVSAEHTVGCDLGDDAGHVEVEPRLRRLFAAYSRDPERGKFELFPANRRLAGASFQPSPAPSSDASMARLRLTSDPEKYAGLRGVLRDLVRRDAEQTQQLLAACGIVLLRDRPDSLAPFKEAVAALLPNLRLHEITERDGVTAVRFLRRDRTVVELEDLSESEQQGGLFALAFRWLGLCRSVVLIDSPELHVAPADQAQFFGAVASLGTGNQIIAATTSADLVACASKAQVIDLSASAAPAAA